MGIISTWINNASWQRPNPPGNSGNNSNTTSPTPAPTTTAPTTAAPTTTPTTATPVTTAPASPAPAPSPGISYVPAPTTPEPVIAYTPTTPATAPVEQAPAAAVEQAPAAVANSPAITTATPSAPVSNAAAIIAQTPTAPGQRQQAASGPSLRVLFDAGMSRLAPATASVASATSIDAASDTEQRADQTTSVSRAEVVAQAAYAMVARAGGDQSRVGMLLGNA